MAETAGQVGDAAVAFFGPVDVPTENLVDGEDRLAGEIIKAERMVNFIIRLEHRSLDMAVAFQRLVMAGIFEHLIFASPGDWARAGDDIYLQNASGRFKLTVSIATTSATGDSFIHIGVNVVPKGAPVPVIGLRDLGLDEKTFAVDVLAIIKGEITGVIHAASKVRPVE